MGLTLSRDKTELDGKPLKAARSQAELTRTRNSNIMVFVGLSQLTINVLVVARVFFHLI